MISLYVAGDLVGPPEREVAAHLAACEKCCRIAEEFSESSSLIAQVFATPEFGAEFYSGIRCAVLGEITRDRRLSKPSLFRPRWFYATAFAAIVIISGVMLQHFVSNRRESPRDPALASARPTWGQATGTNSPSSSQAAHVPKSPRDKRTQIARVMRPSTSTLTSASTSFSPAALESTTLASSAPSGPASAPQISRIEIQTSDPNIRIIWLSPRKSREPDGTNHDQDHPENSNRK